jgi:hypothetical protein
MAWADWVSASSLMVMAFQFDGSLTVAAAGLELGEGAGVAVGAAVGAGVGEAAGAGVGDAVGAGVGDGETAATADGVAAALGAADGDGVVLPQPASSEARRIPAIAVRVDRAMSPPSVGMTASSQVAPWSAAPFRPSVRGRGA